MVPGFYLSFSSLHLLPEPFLGPVGNKPQHRTARKTTANRNTHHRELIPALDRAGLRFWGHLWRRRGFPGEAAPHGLSSCIPAPENPFQGCCCSFPVVEKWESSSNACGTSPGTRQEQRSTCTPHGPQHGWVLAASLPRAEGALAKGVPLAQELVFAVVIHLVLFHPAGVVRWEK